MHVLITSCQNVDLSQVAAAQVNSLKRISFKELLQHYKKQPQARPDIFRSVIIEQSPNDLAVTKTGDIIEFYNAVLIPAIKNFVLECAPPLLMC